jgi:hypothetical protein
MVWVRQELFPSDFLLQCMCSLAKIMSVSMRMCKDYVR